MNPKLSRTTDSSETEIAYNILECRLTESVYETKCKVQKLFNPPSTSFSGIRRRLDPNILEGPAYKNINFEYIGLKRPIDFTNDND